VELNAPISWSQFRNHWTGVASSGLDSYERSAPVKLSVTFKRLLGWTGMNERPSDNPGGSAQLLVVTQKDGLSASTVLAPASMAGRGVIMGHVVVAVGVLRSRLAEPWTLGLLAQEVHLSRSQLVRAFDATVGTSPMAFLRQMRAQQMARQLCCTDLSIAAVARSVGWTDANYASRCFHAFYGVAPTEFRREQCAPARAA
jgi:AraC-like DNA-binding protein